MGWNQFKLTINYIFMGEPCNLSASGSHAAHHGTSASTHTEYEVQAQFFMQKLKINIQEYQRRQKASGSFLQRGILIQCLYNGVWALCQHFTTTMSAVMDDWPQRISWRRKKPQTMRYVISVPGAVSSEDHMDLTTIIMVFVRGTNQRGCLVVSKKETKLFICITKEDTCIGFSPYLWFHINYRSTRAQNYGFGWIFSWKKISAFSTPGIRTMSVHTF